MVSLFSAMMAMELSDSMKRLDKNRNHARLRNIASRQIKMLQNALDSINRRQDEFT